ncbi:aminopeptidase P family protein [Olivibacter sitiensis]|uniref:aminopeptidase P family protein n=1 Tax=Olivibacter sitiensis TaxID=376470 RepID=UPI00041294B8|nr:aminopeptidase P family protein [Olivibacter sitiensis]
MRELGLHAYIVPSSDPHVNEYLPAHNLCIQCLSGFSGSAGTLVITEDFAGLWTDSRYFEQAEKELEGTGFQLVKLTIPHTPEYIDWLLEKSPQNARIGFHFRDMPLWVGVRLVSQLSQINSVAIAIDLISSCWIDRPALANNPLYTIPESEAGESIADKLQKIRKVMAEKKCTHHLISSLDDIAWILNLRGNDIAYNPVFLSYLLVEQDKLSLFINASILNTKQKVLLDRNGVSIQDYASLYQYLKQVPDNSRILLDDRKSNYAQYCELYPKSELVLETNPSTRFKAVKNEKEIGNMRLSLLKDGVAMVKFAYWLVSHISKEPISELSAAEKLLELRKEQDGFVQPSFETIAGYGPHAALPHYHANEATNSLLQPKGLFLVDSGGQYVYGTSDITRTFCLGEVSNEERQDYTLVLKGLIAGSSIRFPKGSKGYQLDSIVREPIWRAGINYGHGTGHGVGYMLNVHEGPQNISPAHVDVALVPGMVTSIEPGIYRPGKHGIRLENLVLTVHDMETDFDVFYAFETLTLAPIETNIVLKHMLDDWQINWLNTYHKQVYEQLSPRLTNEERIWLKKKTEAI